MALDTDRAYGALGFEFHQNRLKKFKKGEVVLCMGVGNNYDLPFGWESPFIYSKFVHVFGEHFVATEEGRFSIDRIFKVDKEYRFYIPQIDMHFISYFRIEVIENDGLIHFNWIDKNPIKENFAIPVDAPADLIKTQLAYTKGLHLFELKKSTKFVAQKSVKPVKKKTEQVPFITGLHGCKCHPFSSWKESAKAHNQKFNIGDKVKNRCNQKGGFITAISETKGYYSVKYGNRPIDNESRHAAELELIFSAKGQVNVKHMKGLGWYIVMVDKSIKDNIIFSHFATRKLAEDKAIEYGFEIVATKNEKPVPVPSVDHEPKAEVQNFTTAKRDKKSNKRDEIIKFRVTGEVKKLIQELAKHDGKDSVADLVKASIRKYALSSIKFKTPFDFSKLEIIQ